MGGWIQAFWTLGVEDASETIYLDDSESQILSPDSFYAHPDYPMDYDDSKPHRATSLVTTAALFMAFFEAQNFAIRLSNHVIWLKNLLRRRFFWVLN